MLKATQNWFRSTVRWRGSVLPAILPRSLICGASGVLITILHQLGWPVGIPALAGLVPNLVLGLMLVFRTNTAYERFWEGRRLWGSLVNVSRNLARQIWTNVAEPESDNIVLGRQSDTVPGAQSDREAKAATLRLLVAFAVATKLHLRQQPVNQELEQLLPSSKFFKLKQMNNPPLEVAFWIGDYLQQQYQRDRLHIHQLIAMQELLNGMVDSLGGCERILKTPIPLAYMIHLRQLLLLYCLTLPFQFVSDLGWWTSLVVVLISFTLFGIEEIAVEIENPFGQDANDLPLDAICETMLRNVEDLMTLTPSAGNLPNR
jgi:putative membrane protein